MAKDEQCATIRNVLTDFSLRNHYQRRFKWTNQNSAGLNGQTKTARLGTAALVIRRVYYVVSNMAAQLTCL